MYSSYYRGNLRENVCVSELEQRVESGEAARHADITTAVLSGLIQNTHAWLTSDSGSHYTRAQVAIFPGCCTTHFSSCSV